MAYRVVLADSAKADAYGIYARVVAAAPYRGPLWFEELISRLYSLEHHPLRCPLARETAVTGRKIRCLLIGRRRNVYRILYEAPDGVDTSYTPWGHEGHGSGGYFSSTARQGVA